MWLLRAVRAACCWPLHPHLLPSLPVRHSRQQHEAAVCLGLATSVPVTAPPLQPRSAATVCCSPAQLFLSPLSPDDPAALTVRAVAGSHKVGQEEGKDGDKVMKAVCLGPRWQLAFPHYGTLPLAACPAPQISCHTWAGFHPAVGPSPVIFYEKGLNAEKYIAIKTFPDVVAWYQGRSGRPAAHAVFARTQHADAVPCASWPLHCYLPLCLSPRLQCGNCRWGFRTGGRSGCVRMGILLTRPESTSSGSSTTHQG